MEVLTIISRMLLAVLLFIMGLVAPFWVTAVLAGLCIVMIPVCTEAVIVVVLIEFLSHGFVGDGLTGWLLLLLLVVCESRREIFRITVPI